MGLRDILKKKDKIEDNDGNRREDAVNRLQAPEFTFIRSDTHTHEVIHPPRGPDSIYEPEEDINHLSANDAQSPTTGAPRPNRLSEAFRSRGSSLSISRSPSGSHTPDRPSPGRRLSKRLHLSRAPASSENVPADLPEIVTTTADVQEPAEKEGAESQWEKRATLLAKTAGDNEALHRSAPTSPALPVLPVSPALLVQDGFTSMRIVDDGNRADAQNGVASTPRIDADIQEAIRLHEDGDLERSTELFGQLANPNGANNPLSQVLFGLALR